MGQRERIQVQDGRKPGWHWAAHNIIDQYGAQLGPYGLALYYALCRHTNQKGESWPSYNTLARETGMSRRQARETMKRLIELELVSKRMRKREGTEGQISNLYVLLEVGNVVPQVGNVVPRGRECGAPEVKPIKDIQERRKNISKKKDSREQCMLDASEENRYRYIQGKFSDHIEH